MSVGPRVFASQNPTGPRTESSGSMPPRMAMRADSTGFAAAELLLGQIAPDQFDFERAKQAIMEGTQL